MTSPPPPGSSIHVERISSRSFSTTLLQTGLRAVRGHLLKPPKDAPEGSPQLSPPPFVYEQCTVHERRVQGIRIYDINVRSLSTNRFVTYSQTTRDPAVPNVNKPHAAKPDLTAQKQQQQQQASQPTAQNGAPTAPSGPSSTAHTSSSGPNTLTQTTTSDLHTPNLTPTTSNLDLTRTRTRDFAHKVTDKRPKPRQIFYFAGGSWRQPASKEHWQVCTTLAKTLTSRGIPTTVSLVSYPLAPKSPACISFPQLEKLYYELFQPLVRVSPDPGNPEQYMAHSDEDVRMPEVILAGDSSGGNIVLGLTLHILSRDRSAPRPESLFTISPTAHMSCDNPEIRKIEKTDPLLSHKAIQETHAGWTASATKDGETVSGIPEDDPRVSPLEADLSILADKFGQDHDRRGVHVNGIMSGNDVLTPDCRKLLLKLAEAGVYGRWLEGEKMMHCFHLTFGYGIAEGKKAVDWMVGVIESERKSERSLQME